MNGKALATRTPSAVNMGLTHLQRGSMRTALQTLCKEGILVMIKSMPSSWTQKRKFNHAWKSILLFAGIRSVGIEENCTSNEILESLFQKEFINRARKSTFQHHRLFRGSVKGLSKKCILAGFESLSDERLRNEISFYRKDGIDSPWLDVLPEDIGSIYEMILEIFPKEVKGDIILDSRADRKEKGAVHTPVDLTEHQFYNALKASKIPASKWWKDVLGCDIGHGGGAYILTFARKFAERCNRKVGDVLRSHVIGFDIDQDVLDIAAFCFHLEANCPSKPTKYHLYQVDSLNGEKARNFINTKISKLKNNFNLKSVIYLGNPPYGQKILEENEHHGFSSLKSANSAAYFLEQAVRIAQEKDVICQVVPISLVHSKKAISIRKFLQEHCSMINVETFDVVPGYMFNQGKSTSSTSKSITIRVAILTMVVGKPLRVLRTSKYVRWSSDEREILFDNPLIRLNKNLYEDYQWPKIGNKESKEIMVKILQNDCTIKSILDKNGGFKLYIADSPRYYISAVHKDLDRGQRVIALSSSFDRDLAQVIICSDLFYWYWRTTEGEFSLTQKCIQSMPIPSKENILKHEDEIKKLAKRLRNVKILKSCYKPKENKGTKNNYKFDKNPDLMKNLNDLMHKIFDIKKYYHFHADKAHSIAEYNQILETGIRPPSLCY